MIAYLQGQLVHLGKESVTLVTNGVGYEVFIPTPSLQDFAIDEHITLWVYTVVREDSLTLFGFLTEAERHLFVSLLKVDRIGPKMALRILSSDLSVEQIFSMIQSKDVTGLSRLPKVGLKMAEQIVFRLKGRLQNVTPHSQSSKHQTIGTALLNLGFKPIDVEKALMQIPKDSSFEEGVKNALAFLSNPKNT